MRTDILQIHDGLEPVYLDVLEANRRLWFLLGNPKTLTDKISDVAARLNDATPEEVKEAGEARQTLVQAIRQAFEMQPFDKRTGQGATDLHCLAVYQQFCQFLSQQEAATSAASP